MIKLLYIAGAYRGPTREAVERNIQAAMHAAALAVRKGWYPVVPHACTAHFDRDYPGLAGDEFYLEATLELMRRCDAVMTVQGWEFSSGAMAEIDEAHLYALPVYRGDALPDLKKGETL